MSGVVALFSLNQKPISDGLIHKIAEAAAWRGPDGIHFLQEANMAFAHLAFNTTAEALRERQPLQDEGQKIIIVADARIDNRKELISELYNYITDANLVTDVELILAAYKKWGDKCAIHLIGDFSFVIWDGLKKYIFAVRDALGVCPLHFSMYDNMLCLTSEAQQLWHHPSSNHTIDNVALAQWLAYGLPHSEHSFYEGIAPVPAGHTLMYKDGELFLNCYWHPKNETTIYYKTHEEYSEHLIALISRCVADRLRTPLDVIGSHLSGGMDSTTVTSIAHKLLKPTGKNLKAFAWEFKSMKSCDESSYARSVGDFIGLSPNLIDAEKYWLFDNLEHYTPSLEGPGCGFDSLIGEGAKQLKRFGGQVMLTGIGGDYTVWGSPLLYSHRFWHGDLKVFRRLFMRSLRIGNNPLTDIIDILLRPAVPNTFRVFLRKWLKRKNYTPNPWISPFAFELLGNSKVNAENSCINILETAKKVILNEATNPNMSANLQGYNELVGRLGIEGRHPFVDRRLVEFVLSVPPEILNYGIMPKWLLRFATKDLLPQNVRWREDKPHLLEYWAKGLHMEKKAIVSILNKRYNCLDRFIDIDKLLRDYQDYLTKPAMSTPVEFISVLNLLIWWQIYDDRRNNSG